MRWIYNCALTAAELYENAPLELYKHSLPWWREQVGGFLTTHNDAIAQPFIYSIKLILEYMIENNVRFNTTFSNGYIDFECVDGDDFMEQRQIGRFKDIDFVNTDFKGYQFNYYYRYSMKDTSRFLKEAIYLGKEIKEKFLEKVNSGENIYTVDNVGIDFFIDDVYKKFPYLKKSYIKKLLRFGHSRMFQAIKKRCAISIISKSYNFIIYVGSLRSDPAKQIKEYYYRMRNKIFTLAKWRHDTYEKDIFYIYLRKADMQKWASLNNLVAKKGAKWIRFEKIMARKIPKVAWYAWDERYIFKVKLKQKYRKRYNVWFDFVKFKEIELIGESRHHKFYKYDQVRDWIPLIDEYLVEEKKKK